MTVCFVYSIAAAIQQTKSIHPTSSSYIPEATTRQSQKASSPSVRGTLLKQAAKKKKKE